MPADPLPEKKRYRPPVLDGVAEAIEAEAEHRNPAPLPVPGTFVVHVVRRGDTLGKIAAACLGDAKRWREIFEINWDKLVDPDRIYCGMTLRVPKPPP